MITKKMVQEPGWYLLSFWTYAPITEMSASSSSSSYDDDDAETRWKVLFLKYEYDDRCENKMY